MEAPSNTVTNDLQTSTLESKGKGKEKDQDQDESQEQPPPTMKLPDDVLVVDTAQTFHIAVCSLQEYTTWAVDCEGFNLGTQGGGLSILSIRGILPIKTTDSLPKTFLFDIVLLTHAETGCSIAPLLGLLASSSIRKVFWDGRMDFCAIYFGLGTALNNVVDLQVVEMRRRLSEETVQKQFQRLMRFFNPRHFQDARRKQKYLHVHLLQGLGGCLLENKVETERSKGSVDHDSWMIRPLSNGHLFYAANDVYLMGVLFVHFEDRGLIDDAIVLQSHRYVTIWKDQAPMEGDVYRSNPFFALEILNYDETSSKRTCGGCGRNLSQNSFPDGSWDRQRENRLCHVCDLIPTWQRREQFFADLKVKKKEEQEKKRAEAERNKKGKGKERVEGETVEQVVDEKPKEVDAPKAASGSPDRHRRPPAGPGDPSGRPTKGWRTATSNTTEKGGEVAEDGRKGFAANRGNPPNRGRGVPTVSSSTDGTRRDDRGPRGGVRGQGRRVNGFARGSQATVHYVTGVDATAETTASHPQQTPESSRGRRGNRGRGGRGGGRGSVSVGSS